MPGFRWWPGTSARIRGHSMPRKICRPTVQSFPIRISNAELLICVVLADDVYRVIPIVLKVIRRRACRTWALRINLGNSVRMRRIVLSELAAPHVTTRSGCGMLSGPGRGSNVRLVPLTFPMTGTACPSRLTILNAIIPIPQNGFRHCGNALAKGCAGDWDIM